jgi:hypothetical protein
MTRENSKCEKRFAAMGSTSWSGSTCVRASLICFVIGRCRWQQTAATYALAEVDDPTDAIHTLDRITTPKQVAPKRTVKAFNPVAREDHQLFQVLLNGQHCVRGFSNPDIREKLRDSPFLKTLSDAKRQSARVSRLVHRCHAHGLIAKVPHSRRWRVTRLGRVAMAASIQLREIKFPRGLYKARFMTKTLLCKKRRTHR